jgi:hypothetical protein
MGQATQLQFRLMSYDSQCAAIRRLALAGADETEISLKTGLAPDHVRKLLNAAMPGDVAPSLATAYRPRRRQSSSILQQ